LYNKSFHDPEGAALHQKQVERDRLRASAEARSSTPVVDQANQEEGKS